MNQPKQPIRSSAAISASSEAPSSPNTVVPNFTATGRPFSFSKPRHGSGLTGLGMADSMGLAPPDILPHRYTDDSIISIPVLPPNGLPGATVGLTTPRTMAWSTAPDTANNDEGPIKHEPKTNLKFWRFRRQSASSQIGGDPSTSSRRKSKSKDNFVMKSVTRGDYLKHYAKDEEGRYIGTEEPAVDCILRHAADYLKWRRPATTWQNEFDLAPAEAGSVAFN